ncbi:hypothetical protein GCM10010412_045780 [Nonomuraea recticatena]|uniref:Uncharacterized protein n=1 Tax=Nonomuraea recticatena TaxID=46178 RepID=A0ABN3S4M2_9ACTN
MALARGEPDPRTTLIEPNEHLVLRPRLDEPDLAKVELRRVLLMIHDRARLRGLFTDLDRGVGDGETDRPAVAGPDRRLGHPRLRAEPRGKPSAPVCNTARTAAEPELCLSGAASTYRRDITREFRVLSRAPGSPGWLRAPAAFHARRSAVSSRAARRYEGFARSSTPTVWPPLSSPVSWNPSFR